MTNDPNADTPDAERRIDKTQDAVGPTSASTTGSESTRAFLRNAVACNCYEIEAAQIALARSSAEEVRALARQMLKDHQALGARIRHTLSDLGELGELDEKLDSRRRGMIDHLRDAPVGAFEPRYLDQQLAAHREAVSLFAGYAENGDHPQVKALAAAALPMLETHLDHVARLRGH